MTVCRYFLQGNCRFGDRCRFEHSESNYNYNNRNYENQRDRYSRQENFRYENQYGNQYDANNKYVNQRSYSSDRYSDHYRHDSPQRYSGGYDNQYSKYNQGYELQPRYNDANRGRSHQYSNNYQAENNYGQNRFRWLSDDYAQQHQQKEHKKDYGNETYSTSTPKGKVPFSFKLSESEIKKDSSFSTYQTDEQEQLRVELVKEDAKSSELGGQWPFSCYFPFSGRYGFPGFSDISPEELRYAAYKAEESNLYESYLKSVQEILLQVNQLRSQLQIPTPQLLATLSRIWNGENLCSTSAAIASIPFVQSEEMATDTMDSLVPNPSNNAANFSFKMATETELSDKAIDTAFKVPANSTKSSAAAFSFKIPSASEAKSTVSASSGDSDIYTSLESLTDEEKEQFSASTFVLGKIPTRPPPQMLCI